MSTQAMEVHGMPEQYQAAGRQALDRFRRMIAKAMKHLGHEADSPRYVEASLRLNPFMNHPQYMLEVKDLTIERAVYDTIQQLDDNWSPTVFEARCEFFRIPLDAYTDIYAELGMMPTTTGAQSHV